MARLPTFSLVALLAFYSPFCVFCIHPPTTTNHNDHPSWSLRSLPPKKTTSQTTIALHQVISLSRGGDGWLPAGYNPFGLQITSLGKKYLKFGGSMDGDVGRLLSSLKSRKKMADIQSTWLEIVRASKQGQSMRIYRTLEDLIQFCLDAGLID